MEKIRLAIVDDHPLFREGVASILSAEEDIEIVGQGSNAESAIQLAKTVSPDIMLLDINMPGGGMFATQTIKEVASTVKIIILTGLDEDDYVLEALRAGAQAYLLKGVMSGELIDVLHLVQDGQSYVTPILAGSLLREMSQTQLDPPPNDKYLNELSERENQILVLIADGLSNLEIGQRLYLSEKTIKHYITNILHKLNVQNRVQAALYLQNKLSGGSAARADSQKTQPLKPK